MSPRPRVKTLRIDGRDIGARENETILQVALENDIRIPTMCYLKGLRAVGSCRMCMVELEGSPRLVPACKRLVEEGMVVRTDTERLRHYRRRILELLFAERNHICAVCVANGHCELQGLAHRLGLTHFEIPFRQPAVPVDSTHARFVVDHHRCILCTRCVRVCEEIEGARTWDIMNRGVDARVITDLNQPWGESPTCTSCGKCVQVCPTGALTEKETLRPDTRKHREFLPYLRTMREVNP